MLVLPLFSENFLSLLDYGLCLGIRVADALSCGAISLPLLGEGKMEIMYEASVIRQNSRLEET